MGKRLLNLYVDDDLIEAAKEKRINMSERVRAMLNVEIGISKKNPIESLKLMNTKLTASLERANIKITKLEAQNERDTRPKGRIIHC